MNPAGLFGGLGAVFMLIYFGFIGLTIYIMVLFIKVAKRGITALDIYINKNNRGKDDSSKDIALNKENL